MATVTETTGYFNTANGPGVRTNVNGRSLPLSWAFSDATQPKVSEIYFLTDSGNIYRIGRDRTVSLSKGQLNSLTEEDVRNLAITIGQEFRSSAGVTTAVKEIVFVTPTAAAHPTATYCNIIERFAGTQQGPATVRTTYIARLPRQFTPGYAYFARDALDSILREADGRLPNEARGYLIGRYVANQNSELACMVLDAPGVTDSSSRVHVAQDFSKIEAILRKADETPDITQFIGEWHTHVVDIMGPSAQDFDVIRDLMASAPAALPRYSALVLTYNRATRQFIPVWTFFTNRGQSWQTWGTWTLE